MITDLIELEGLGYEFLVAVKYLKDCAGDGQLKREDVATMQLGAQKLAAKALAVRNKAFGQDIPAGVRPSMIDDVTGG